MNRRVRRIGTGGIITTVAGGGNQTADEGLARAAQLTTPKAVAVDSGQNFWIADSSDMRVRYVAG